MEESRKKNNSEKMKENWIRAEKYANQLAVSKNEAYNNLALLDKYGNFILEGNRYYINLVKSEGRWNTYGLVKEIADDSREKEDKKKYDDSPVSDLKLMIWVINKIGNTKKAEKIFNAAKTALEAIEEK